MRTLSASSPLRAGAVLRGEPAHPRGQGGGARPPGADGAQGDGRDQPQGHALQHLPLIVAMTTAAAAGLRRAHDAVECLVRCGHLQFEITTMAARGKDTHN